MMGLDVLGAFGVDEHRAREGVIDAESHGFPAARQRRNRCHLLVANSIAAGLMALYMRNWIFLHSNHFRQEFGRQIPSDTAMGFPQDRTGNRCIVHRRHEQLGGVSVCCMVVVVVVVVAVAVVVDVVFCDLVHHFLSHQQLTVLKRV